MSGLVLSESTNPWTSGKSVLFAWDDVNGRWEIRSASGPISGQYQNAGGTLLGTINNGRVGNDYDHLTIERSGGTYTFNVNGNNAQAGRKTLAESGLTLIRGDSMAHAAQEVVKAVNA